MFFNCSDQRPDVEKWKQFFPHVDHCSWKGTVK